MNVCKNCQHKFEGDFCSNCGEKVLGKDDLKVKNIFKQAFVALTDVDSKLLKSLKLLFFYPGELTRKYVDGIRVPYLKPFQMFLLANILFYLFLSEIDIFRTPSKWYFQDKFDGIHVLAQVREISKEKKITIEEVAVLYDKRSSDLAKGLMVFLIPFMSLIAYLLNFKRKHRFGEHVIFSIHFFSFMLFFMVIWTEIVGLFNISKSWVYIVPITLAIYLYYILSLKRFYKNNWVMSIFKGVLAVFLIVVAIQFYRVSINLLTLNYL